MKSLVIYSIKYNSSNQAMNLNPEANKVNKIAIYHFVIIFVKILD